MASLYICLRTALEKKHTPLIPLSRGGNTLTRKIKVEEEEKVKRQRDRGTVNKLLMVNGAEAQDEGVRVVSVG